MIKNKEKELKRALEDAEIQSIVSTRIRQGSESVVQFKAGGRTDLMEKEEAEIAILKSYLPEQLTEAEITEIVKQAAEQTGASSLKEMGALMKAVMPRVKGKAEGKVVNEIVRRYLTD